MPRPPSRLKRTMKVYRAVGEEVLGPLGFQYERPLTWPEFWFRHHAPLDAYSFIWLGAYFRQKNLPSILLDTEVGVALPALQAAVRAVRGDDWWTSDAPPRFKCPLWLAVLNANAPPVSSPEERVAFQMREADNIEEELRLGFEVIVPPLPGHLERAHEVWRRISELALPWLDAHVRLRTLLPLWRTWPPDTGTSDHLEKATACWLIGEREAMEEEIALAEAAAGGADQTSDSFGMEDPLTVGQFAERLRTTTPEGLGLPPHPERRAARQE